MRQRDTAGEDETDVFHTEIAVSPRTTPPRGAGLRKERVGLLALGVLVLILGGLSIAAQRQRATASPVINMPMVFGKPDMAQTTPTAKLPGDYAGFDPSQLAKGYGEPPMPVRPTPNEASGQDNQEEAELERLRALLAQTEAQQFAEERERALAEHEAAMTSPLLFKTTPPSRIASLAQEDEGVRAGEGSRLEQPSRSLGLGPLNQSQDAKARFLNDGSSIEPYLRKPLLNSHSAFELKAGGFIPVALVTAINSDLPGEVVAQVRENVFDTVTGNNLLIPQGARVLGKYQSLVSNGQNRALIVWTRLVMPNGDSIVLEGMPGTDQAGAAGAHDEVDYHLDKLAAAATLSTAIAYGGNLAREGGRDRDDLDVVGETIAQESSKIGGRIIDRQLNVAPTIRIRQGHPLNVLINKDMILRPYKID